MCTYMTSNMVDIISIVYLFYDICILYFYYLFIFRLRLFPFTFAKINKQTNDEKVILRNVYDDIDTWVQNLILTL